MIALVHTPAPTPRKKSPQLAWAGREKNGKLLNAIAVVRLITVIRFIIRFRILDSVKNVWDLKGYLVEVGLSSSQPWLLVEITFG